MRCPQCRELTGVRNGKRILSDGRHIAKFFCPACDAYWTAEHEQKNEGEKIDPYAVVTDSIERTSMRILARRYQTGTRQIKDIIHRVTALVKDSLWVAKNFSLTWSGVLVFDGKVVKVYDPLSIKFKGKLSEQELKWMNKQRWLCGIDFGTGDLPHYELAAEESKIDLVMYFQKLKEIGYPLRVLVCDGNEDIPAAAIHVFGDNIIVQLCTRHFIEGLKRHAEGRAEEPRIAALITTIQRVIESDSAAQAVHFLSELKVWKKRPGLETDLTALFKKHAEQLGAHILHPDLKIPHTSNDIENLFKQLMLRIKSIGRFQHWQYARDYLKTWAMWRRCTPFTDCRKTRKARNGKAPIELAGAIIDRNNFLKM